jgi:hypothetical protein
MRREHRLLRHVETALQGGTAPVCEWIRELSSGGLEPDVFVIERIPGDADWRSAEAAAIGTWNSWPASRLPYTHPPMTPKSIPTEIRRVALLNVQCLPTGPVGDKEAMRGGASSARTHSG